jgi:hypothetical protein
VSTGPTAASHASPTHNPAAHPVPMPPHLNITHTSHITSQREGGISQHPPQFHCLSHGVCSRRAAFLAVRRLQADRASEAVSLLALCCCAALCHCLSHCLPHCRLATTTRHANTHLSSHNTQHTAIGMRPTETKIEYRVEVPCYLCVSVLLWVWV